MVADVTINQWHSRCWCRRFPSFTSPSSWLIQKQTFLQIFFILFVVVSVRIEWRGSFYTLWRHRTRLVYQWIVFKLCVNQTLTQFFSPWRYHVIMDCVYGHLLTLECSAPPCQRSHSCSAGRHYSDGRGDWEYTLIFMINTFPRYN